MTKNLPHLAVEYRDDINPIHAKEFQSQVYTENLKFELRSRPSDTVYAIAEWAIPTAIVAYVVKPYFDVFLKEAAKDHYQLLKNGIAKLAVDSNSNIRMKVISSGKNKIDKDVVFSRSFSIRYIDQENKVSFKFLFRETASESQIKEASDYFLDLIKDFNDCGKNSELGMLIAEKKPISHPVFICYNEVSKEALILKPFEAIEENQISRE